MYLNTCEWVQIFMKAYRSHRSRWNALRARLERHYVETVRLIIQWVGEFSRTGMPTCGCSHATVKEVQVPVNRPGQP